jgi:tetrahydromethanopterin S-methyltransferase subunit G
VLSLEDLGSQIPAERYQRVADAIGADVGVMAC